MSDPTIIATVEDPTGSGSDSGTLMISASSIPPNSIENMADVDLTGLTDGALLIYRNNTAKWAASTMLDKQNMEGGEF
jgi:hypothetical protein